MAGCSSAEITTMNEHHFDAEILLSDRVEGTDWVGAADVLRERVYGAVRVRADWSAPNGAPVVRVPVQVIGCDARNAPAYVELFSHDIFLILNIAAPGSFGGVVSVSGGEYRVNELAFDARVFAYAASSLRRLPLRDVASWFDALEIGTRQVATNGVTRALFHLLHLARGVEDDEATVMRLARAADALEVPVQTLAPLREMIARGTAPVLHPMMDDALDPAIDDPSLDWSAAIDDAASRVIGALQAKVRG
jgi:hypothetical protein